MEHNNCGPAQLTNQLPRTWLLNAPTDTHHGCTTVNAHTTGGLPTQFVTSSVISLDIVPKYADIRWLWWMLIDSKQAPGQTQLNTSIPTHTKNQRKQYHDPSWLLLQSPHWRLPPSSSASSRWNRQRSATCHRHLTPQSTGCMHPSGEYIQYGASSGRIRLTRWRHCRKKQRKPKEVPRFISQSPQNHPPRFGWKKPPIPTHLGQHMEPWPTQQQADFENHEVWGVPSNWRVQWSSPVLECSGITGKFPNISEDEGGRMQQELSIIWRRALFREKNT